MKNNKDYFCDIYGKNGKITEVKVSGYSAEFVYRPPNIENITQSQKEKLEFLTQILNEET